MTDPPKPPRDAPPRESPQLLARLRRRDEAAFNEFVRSYQGPVYRMLLRLLGDAAEAEDIAQEVFVSAFKAIENFRGESALGTWLYRIAHNHALNRIQYRGRRAAAAQRPIEDQDRGSAWPGLGSVPVTPEQLAEGRQAEDHVQRALMMLDDDQRLLICLGDIENLSYEEIREFTGLPIGTIKSKLHRARSALHQHFLQLRRGR